MAKVSISEAARLAGVSRQHLYKKWITPGLLSVEKDGVSSPVIDTSEVLRVFGGLKSQGFEPETSSETVEALKTELKLVREMLSDRETLLSEARAREQWLQLHVNKITGAAPRLEDKSGDTEQLKSLQEKLRKYQAAYQSHKEALAVERNKGLLARVFNR